MLCFVCYCKTCLVNSQKLVIKALSHLRTFSYKLFVQTLSWEQIGSQHLFAWEQTVLMQCSCMRTNVLAWEQDVLMQEQNVRLNVSCMWSKSLKINCFIVHSVLCCTLAVRATWAVLCTRARCYATARVYSLSSERR